jgi:hypothetical protein
MAIAGGLGLRRVWVVRRLIKYGVVLQGTVDRIFTSQHDRDRMAFVSYCYRGKKDGTLYAIDHRPVRDRLKNLAVGQVVDVVVDPATPSRAIMAEVLAAITSP